MATKPATRKRKSMRSFETLVIQRLDSLQTGQDDIIRAFSEHKDSVKEAVNQAKSIVDQRFEDLKFWHIPWVTAASLARHGVYCVRCNQSLEPWPWRFDSNDVSLIPLLNGVHFSPANLNSGVRITPARKANTTRNSS